MNPGKSKVGLHDSGGQRRGTHWMHGSQQPATHRSHGTGASCTSPSPAVLNLASISVTDPALVQAVEELPRPPPTPYTMFLSDFALSLGMPGLDLPQLRHGEFLTGC
ncbi:MAG: hypothetical protein WDW38_010382 [Sanguina aurantia]